MDPIQTHSAFQPVAETIGKASLVATIYAKSMAFLGIAEVNQWATFVVTAITAFYFIFKGLNEYSSWRDRKSKRGKK
jgi:hypothetical protein